MSLREMTRRTLTVISCLPYTWDDVKKKATDTVQDRFREAEPLVEFPDAGLAQEFVEKHLAFCFRTAPFRTASIRPGRYSRRPSGTQRNSRPMRFSSPSIPMCERAYVTARSGS